MKTKVLIVDDHPVTRAGVRAILETNNSIDIIGEAIDGRDAVSKVGKNIPDVVVMDITMPQLSGSDATKEILDKQPNIKVIALSIHSGRNFVKEMLDAGAVGYLLKDDAPEELLLAIEKVAEGDMYLGSKITRTVLQKEEGPERAIIVDVLNSKLHRPPVMADYVVRTKIIHELECNIYKPLTMVSAGAGYGKSVTISQWLEQTKFLKSWISLDDEHNDIRIFLNYLVAAVEKILPGLLQETGSLLSDSALPSIGKIANILINELCDNEKNFILILDNYHTIKERKIHDLFDIWLRFPPPNVHLCIITRRDPPLAIKSLQLSDRMTEIRTKDLSFSETEIADLFHQVKYVDLEDESAKLLHDKTEGWIIALRLVAMVITNKEDIEHILKSFEGGLNSISDYLLTEILSNQTTHIQDQLMETSLLNRFSAVLIDEVIGDSRKDAPTNQQGINVIKWLTSSNLFVVSLDNEQKWFRYHRLFKNFLQNELKKRKTGPQVDQLHIRASQWFEKNEIIEEAIYHAMTGGDTDRTARIIGEHWEVTLDSDNWLTVEGWLTYLPEHIIVNSANLLICRLLVSIKKHRIGEIPLIFEQIERIGDGLNNIEKGYLAFAKGVFSYFVGNGKKALDYCNQALQDIPTTYYSFRADLWTYWSWSMQITGQGENAIRTIEDKIKNINPPQELIQLSRFRSHICAYSLLKADLNRLVGSSKDFFSTVDLSKYMLAFVNYIRGMIYWWGNEASGLVREFNSIDEFKYLATSRSIVDMYICKALALNEIGRPLEANDTIMSAILYAEETDDPMIIREALSGKTRLYLLQENIDAAVEWLNNTEPGALDPSMLFWVEVSSITYCRVLIAIGSPESLREAVELLKQYRQYSESIYYKIRTIEIAVLQTVAYSKSGLEKDALESLRFALELASPGKWIRPFTEQYQEISKLLQELIKEDIKPGFIDQIFKSIEKQKKVTIKADESAENIKPREKKDKLTILTTSELKVLEYLAEGLRNKEIADKLFVSEDTIKKHVYHMFQKFHVKNRLSLITKTKTEGILE